MLFALTTVAAAEVLSNPPAGAPVLFGDFPTLLGEYLKPLIEAVVLALCTILAGWAHVIGAKINGGKERDEDAAKINAMIDKAKAHGIASADAFLAEAESYGRIAFPDLTAKLERSAVGVRNRIIRQIGTNGGVLAFPTPVSTQSVMPIAPDGAVRVVFPEKT